MWQWMHPALCSLMLDTVTEGAILCSSCQPACLKRMVELRWANQVLFNTRHRQHRAEPFRSATSGPVPRGEISHPPKQPIATHPNFNSEINSISKRPGVWPFQLWWSVGFGPLPLFQPLWLFTVPCVAIFGVPPLLRWQRCCWPQPRASTAGEQPWHRGDAQQGIPSNMSPGQGQTWFLIQIARRSNLPVKVKTGNSSQQSHRANGILKWWDFLHLWLLLLDKWMSSLSDLIDAARIVKWMQHLLSRCLRFEMTVWLVVSKTCLYAPRSWEM